MKIAMTWGTALVVAGVGTAVLVAGVGTAVLVAGVGTAVLLADDKPTETQLRQLFDSVARPTPDKIRVVSLRTQEETPPGQQEIQRVADAWRKMEERSQEGAPEPQRTQRIEQAVRSRLQTMTGRHFAKIQEWKSGASYRQDVANGWESLNEAAVKTYYDSTRINLVNPTNGAASMREIMYAIKSFRKRDGDTRYAEAGAWNGIATEERVAMTVALTLANDDSIRQKAKNERHKLVLDEQKLKQILAGQDSAFKVSVAEKTSDGEPRLVFEFKPLFKAKVYGEATVLIECVKTNFNRITRTEVKSSGGKIQLLSTREKFDALDFPHEYRVIENTDRGYTTNHFSIQDADLAAHFSDDEVFGFEPRKDFGVVVDSSGKPEIKSYPNGITPMRVVDVSDIVAELNSNKPSHIHLLLFVATTVLVSILGIIAWRYFRRVP